jgi:hypothetical protein
MDKKTINESTYYSNEYLEYSSFLGGEVSRANVLFLLKDKKHSVSFLKNPKETDVIFESKKDFKKFYISSRLHSMYSKTMVFDPILNIDSILEIERRWKKEAIKKMSESVNVNKLNIDNVRIKKLNNNSVDIDINDVNKQINKFKNKY